jgi:hypothetical protein
VNTVKSFSLFAFLLLSLILVAGCTSPAIHSQDPKANYRYVFSDINAPEPTVIHSHVERFQRSLLGIFPLRSQYNGEWEFELETSATWLDQVRVGFAEIAFADVWPREVPAWFLPSPGSFSVWRMQSTSHPNAHLFIEKKSPSQERIRVFIRRR